MNDKKLPDAFKKALERPLSVRQAIGIFLAQTGYTSSEENPTQTLHEMMHVLSGGTNGLLSDEGRALIFEMVLLGHTSYILEEMKDGKFVPVKTEEPPHNLIYSLSKNIQDEAIDHSKKELTQIKIDKAADFLARKILQSEYNAFFYADSFDEALLSLASDVREELQKFYAQDEEVQKLERNISQSKELTDQGFVETCNKAHAARAYFVSKKGKTLLDFTLDEMMVMPISDFGIQAVVGPAGKINFVPFISIPQTVTSELIAQP